MVDTSPRQVARAGGRGRLVIRRSIWVFWLLFAINTLNYLDRLIAVAVGPTIKAEFKLTDDAIGLLGSAFLLVYTLAALPVAALADRLRARAKTISLGVAVWSIFSGLTAFVRGYGGLFATRALVGVGEASYSPSSVALLVNYYPPQRRAGIIGRWQVGQVLGALLAFIVAGALFAWLPAHLAWRAAFLFTALPGLALAALAWRMADHPDDHPDDPLDEAASDERSAEQAAQAAPARASMGKEARGLTRQVRSALRIPMIWFVVAMQALSFIVITPAITFLPLYVRERHGPFHLGAAHASFMLGLPLVIGGFLGAILGGQLSDWLNRRLPGGRVVAITIGFALAIPCYCAMLLTGSLPLFLITVTLTTFTLNLPNAALTTIPPDVTIPALRATALAVTMLLSHLLGDIWASWAVGKLSTALGERLAPAMLLVGLPALALGCVVSVFGARVYARAGHSRALSEA